MYIPVERTRTGSCGIYNFILPVGFRLTDLQIVDPFDKNNKSDKKQFKYEVFYDRDNKLQVVQMQLKSNRGIFSFVLKGEASAENSESEFISYQEQTIYLDEDIHDSLFDDGIKKSF